MAPFEIENSAWLLFIETYWLSTFDPPCYSLSWKLISSLFRYKAEIDFDGRELARSYLKRQDLGALLQAAKQIQTEQGGKDGNWSTKSSFQVVEPFREMSQAVFLGSICTCGSLYEAGGGMWGRSVTCFNKFISIFTHE